METQKLFETARFTTEAGKAVQVQAVEAAQRLQEEEQAYRELVAERLAELMKLGRIALAPWNRDKHSRQRLVELSHDDDLYQKAVNAFKFAGTYKEKGEGW